MARRAFTLIELLVVVAIVGVLIGILLPSLARTRQLAHATKCLSNLRSLQAAQLLYANDYRGKLIDVGLSHGGVGDPSIAWVGTLSEYFGTALVIHAPGDDSPYWPAALGGAGMTLNGAHRVTSYGMNNYLSRTYNPGLSRREPFDTLDKIQFTSSTIQFTLLAREGEFAVSDHFHVENWGQGAQPPSRAAAQLQTNAYGGEEKSWRAISNYSFLDGHASTLPFNAVYTDFTINKFNPEVAR